MTLFYISALLIAASIILFYVGEDGSTFEGIGVVGFMIGVACLILA